MFAVHLHSHYDSVLFKHNFELGLQRLAKIELGKLKDALLDKDVCEGYGDSIPPIDNVKPNPVTDKMIATAFICALAVDGMYKGVYISILRTVCEDLMCGSTVRIASETLRSNHTKIITAS